MKAKQICVILVLIIALAISGCVDYEVDHRDVKFPLVIIIEDDIAYILSDNGDLILKHIDGDVSHGKWTVFSESIGSYQYRLDLWGPAYPATVNIKSDGSAELVSDDMDGYTLYGQWY